HSFSDYRSVPRLLGSFKGFLNAEGDGNSKDSKEKEAKLREVLSELDGVPRGQGVHRRGPCVPRTMPPKSQTWWLTPVVHRPLLQPFSKALRAIFTR
ncbi:MAG: hypothetical protein ABGY24_07335, partial [bacterium]